MKSQANIFMAIRIEESDSEREGPIAELDDHVRRIVRSMFATRRRSMIPRQKSVVDVAGGLEVCATASPNRAWFC